MCVPVWYLDVRIPDSQEFPEEWKHLEVTGCAFPGGALMFAFPDSLEFPDGWKHLESPFVYIPGGGHWVRVPGWSFDVCIPRQSGIPRRVETSGISICLHSGWSFDVCIPRQSGIFRLSGMFICLHSGWRLLSACSQTVL